MDVTSDTAVAVLLRSIRRAAELSQRDLARRAGLSPGRVADYERGARQPSFPMMARLIAAAGGRLVAFHRAAGFLEPHPDEDKRDRGGRHYPAHEHVWTVRRRADWWKGVYMRWDEQLPQYSFRSRYSMWTPWIRHWDSWSADPAGLERAGAT